MHPSYCAFFVHSQVVKRNDGRIKVMDRLYVKGIRLVTTNFHNQSDFQTKPPWHIDIMDQEVNLDHQFELM